MPVSKKKGSPGILRDAIARMQNFLRSSRSSPQDKILKDFLTNVIHSGNFSESGSILLDCPADKKLRLFNPDNFLMKEDYLKSGEPWQVEFTYDQGVAGRAFSTRRMINLTDAKKDVHFSSLEGVVPISNMMCIPIITDEYKPPFGVISFHNSSSSKNFDADCEQIAEIYAAILSMALVASPDKYKEKSQRNAKIFIGCSSEDKEIARIIQKQLSGQALVRIWDQGVFKAGGYVLDTLINRVKEYDVSIFIFSDNDIIEYRGNKYFVARDNVIFEAGLFFGQLGRERTVIVTPRVKDLHLPSDLDGLIKLQYVKPLEKEDLEIALGPISHEISEILSS